MEKQKAPVQTGVTATGGVISDYTDPGPGTIYRAHVFTSTGALNVTEVGTDLPATLSMLSSVEEEPGGFDRGGGGVGAFVPGSLTATVQPYPVVIGGGGVAADHQRFKVVMEEQQLLDQSL